MKKDQAKKALPAFQDGNFSAPLRLCANHELTVTSRALKTLSYLDFACFTLADERTQRAGRARKRHHPNL